MEKKRLWYRCLGPPSGHKEGDTIGLTMLDERRRTGGRTEDRNAGEIMVECDLHEILGWGECGTRIPEYARRESLLLLSEARKNAMMGISIRIVLVVTFVWVSDKMHGMCR
jgi:hypothetical protein